MFEDSSTTNPDFDQDNYAWDHGDEWNDPDFINYKINDCYYIDKWMEFYGFFHDEQHYWDHTAIGYRNAAGDEIILYPDHMKIMIGGVDLYPSYPASVRNRLESGNWVRTTITNGEYFFVYDNVSIQQVCRSLPNYYN